MGQVLEIVTNILSLRNALPYYVSQYFVVLVCYSGYDMRVNGKKR